MKLPSVKALEDLYPDLIRLAIFPNFKTKSKQNLIRAMATATRLWTIKRSLYDASSDIYVGLDSNSFKCATWEKLFKERVPDCRQRTCAKFLFSECSPNEIDDWEKTVRERYSIDSSTVENLLSTPIFKVDSRTIRNHFKRLSKLKQPILKVSKSIEGEYTKLSSRDIEEYEEKISSIIEYGNNDALDLIDEGLSTIAELLLKKINGEQRLYIHTEYIVDSELQDIADDWANKLKEIWQQIDTPPIAIEYDSASNENVDKYIVYPVCLYYHQRAFYLCAYGQCPSNSSEFGWYNYRLERINELSSCHWDESSVTQQLKNKIYNRAQIKPEYKPEQIRLELDLAYGFDFYHPRATMLLRFNHYFGDRYIENTDRHPTFEKVDLDRAISIVERQPTITELSDSQKQQTINILERNLADTLYKLDYRVGDNSVIMRLRAWCPNVEVIYPWNLRQRMREDIEQTWRLYESDR